MSRIGKLPITVPAGVTVTVDENNFVTVKGPKGTLTQQVNPVITRQAGRQCADSRIAPATPSPTRPCTACTARWCTTWSYGVTEGFSKTLEMVGTGYRARPMNGNEADHQHRLLPSRDPRRAREHHL